MSLSILGVFRVLFRWSEGADEEPSEEANVGRFVPSPLDRSVRVAHGGSDDTIVRELSKVDEKARELENTRRDNQVLGTFSSGTQDTGRCGLVLHP